MFKSEYGFFEKLLHRLTLGIRMVAEASFDLEQAFHRFDFSEIVSGRHVFVAGLARAGTTILLRRLYATGIFRSLIYRDMPFVLMPNLWRGMTRLRQRQIGKKKRAHDDGIWVDFDSPEALEEVFWRVFAGDHYIRPDSLVPMTVSNETRGKFQRYVAAILANGNEAPQRRYLSKNNNNILRLPGLKQAFPNAILLIPFRDPLQHAFSLLKQDIRFIHLHQTDAFIGSYMTWLAHHEFGPDHRPFRFSEDPISFNRDTLNYWLKIWQDTYGWLIKHAPQDAYFLSYETLCGQTVKVWEWLTPLVGIENNAACTYEPLRLSKNEIHERVDQSVLRNCDHIYQELISRQMR